jgi:hypothetical protein
LFRALMLINKMAPQKGNIDILWKSVCPF